MTIHLLIVHGPTSRRQGGTLTFLRSLVSRLPGERFSLTLLFLEGGGIAEDFRAQGFHVEVVSAGRLRRLDRVAQTVLAIRRLIKTHHVSLVFSNGALEQIYAGLAAWAAGVPAMWYCHGSSPTFDSVMSAALVIPAQMVVTHSDYTRAHLPNHRRLPVVVVPIGIDEDAAGAVASAIRDEIGIDTTTPLITMVGVFMPWKGQEVFIRAAQLVRARVPTVRFALVGDAPFERHEAYAASLRALADELHLGGVVSFLGFREDRATVMTASDIIVHASTEPEPFGIVLLEAMASGRALITTATGGAREVVTPGESALVVPAGDATALADACVRLVKDPALRQRVGAAGMRRVREKFRIGTMIDSLAERFKQAAQAHSA